MLLHFIIVTRQFIPLYGFVKKLLRKARVLHYETCGIECTLMFCCLGGPVISILCTEYESDTHMD